jgi:PPP family 3-phenylpropionic acid transporter
MGHGKGQTFALGTAYFLYFAVLGIYLPYFNLYCRSLNFSARELGLLSGAVALMHLAGPLFWSHASDRLQARKTLSWLTSFVSSAILASTLFIEHFPLMFVALALYGFFRTVFLPLVDAATWETVETDAGAYGRIRVWGSVGFIAASVAAGYLADVVSLKSAIGLMVFLSCFLAAAALALPRDAASQKTFPDPKLIERALRPSFVLFLIICFLVQTSHGAYYSFFTLFMEEQGFSSTVIGTSWGFSVTAEVILMIQYQRLFKRMKPPAVLGLAAFAAAWRWWMTAHSESIVFLFLAQGLHAFTFAAFHIASQSYLARQGFRERRASMFGLVSSVSYGLGGFVGMTASGFLYDQGGGTRMFGSAGLVALLAGVLALVLNFLPAEKSRAA